MFTAYVYGGQQFDGTHGEMDIWIRTQTYGGHWDKNKGCSTINGSQFYNHINFLDEEDLVVFLLKFAGKACRVKS